MTQLSGVAAVYNDPTAIDGAGQMWEEIDYGAFTDSIIQRSVIAYFQHAWQGQPLGRQANHTLLLTDRPDGLHFDLALPDTSLGRDVAELVERRDIAGVSFGFIPLEESVYRAPDGRSIFVIERARLLEISPVAMPAYPQTSVTVGRGIDPNHLLARLEQRRLTWSAPRQQRHNLPPLRRAPKRYVTAPLLDLRVAA